MYTKKQMKLICTYKLLKHKIVNVISDTEAQVYAINGDREVLLFRITEDILV